MELKHCINYLLSASQNTVFQYFSQKLSDYNITPAQYGVLNCLWGNGDLTPKQIGKLLLLEASSVSGILDRMQTNKLIERKIDPNNRRTIIVSATKKANDMRCAIEAIVVDMNNKFLSQLSDMEKDKLRSNLQKIIEIGRK